MGISLSADNIRNMDCGSVRVVDGVWDQVSVLEQNQDAEIIKLVELCRRLPEGKFSLT